MNMKTVEIVVPVYNEQEELQENITKLFLFCKENLTHYSWNITIANNASIDDTAKKAEALEKELNHVSLVTLSQKGRGRAVKKVWTEKNADFSVYMDLDLSTDLKHLPNLLKALENGYDIAIGSRLKKGAQVEGRTVLRELTSRILNIVFIQLFFATKFSDAQCGFKAVNNTIVTKVLPHVVDDGWFFDGELLIIAEKSGYKIYEEPVHWVDNPGSTVRLLSTIMGDIGTIIRLLRTKPWEKLQK